MLPKDLQGPETGIYLSDDEVAKFIANAAKRYPDLHRDFITQICFELPSHFNAYLPGFDVKKNKIVVRQVSAQWIKENVRYDEDESLETDSFYGFHVEEASRLSEPTGSPLLIEVLTSKTWPFRPVIVEYNHGVKDLGSKEALGHPYHLIEGCHRVSYLLRMLALDLVAPDSEHEILEVV